MKTSHFLIQLNQPDESVNIHPVTVYPEITYAFGKNVDTDGVHSGLGPQLQLSKNLVGERTAHDEGRMSGRTPQVTQTSFGQQDNMST